MGAFRGWAREVSDLFDDLRNVPFLKGGRNIETGLDCYGLCMEASRRAGKEIPDFPFLDDMEEIDEIVRREEEGQFKRLESAQPFSLVIFKMKPPYISHIGMILPDRKTFISISAKMGCCVERLDSSFWKNRIEGFFEWNNNTK